MPDAAPAARRSALATDWRPGDFGALGPDGPRVAFAERRGLAIVQVESDADRAGEVTRRLRDGLGLAPPETFNSSVGGDQLRLVWVGPWRWYAVEPERRPLEAELARKLDGSGAAVVDLSHSRAVLRLGGREARHVLAKGTGIDLHPKAFPAGRAAQTALFHVDTLIDCVDDRPAFDVYVARGFALSLWGSLRRAAAEYGYRVE